MRFARRPQAANADRDGTASLNKIVGRRRNDCHHQVVFIDCIYGRIFVLVAALPPAASSLFGSPAAASRRSSHPIYFGGPNDVHHQDSHGKSCREGCSDRQTGVTEFEKPVFAQPHPMLARPRLVLQSFKAMVGIAMPLKADNPRLDPDLLGDRPGATPVRRQQNNPRPLQIALQRRCPMSPAAMAATA